MERFHFEPSKVGKVAPLHIVVSVGYSSLSYLLSWAKKHIPDRIFLDMDKKFSTIFF